MIIRIEAIINVSASLGMEQGHVVTQTARGTSLNVELLTKFLMLHAESVSVTYENDLEPLEEIGGELAP